MERKFEILDDVIVSGTFTGIGDVKAWIINYSFSKMHRGYFYDAKDGEGNRYHVAERFIEKYRITAERVIEKGKEEFYKTHSQSDRPYEAHFVIGCLSAEYNSLLEKFEKLEAKYKALKRSQEEVLNPIS